MLKAFVLFRNKDISGVSGIGVVAEGVLFSNGKVALEWFGEHASTNIYDSLEDMLFVHSHGSATEVVWDDPPREKKEDNEN